MIWLIGWLIWLVEGDDQRRKLPKEFTKDVELQIDTQNPMELKRPAQDRKEKIQPGANFSRACDPREILDVMPNSHL